MIDTKRRVARIGGLLLLIVLAAGCGGSGASKGRKQEVLATEFDDAKLGEQAAQQMAAQMGLIEMPELTEYISAIGRRMIPFAPRRHFDYSFHVIDQVEPNAFALPGGHIYVSRGLLQLVNSEDELANVIGHEITHAAERHAAARQEYARRMNPLAMGWTRAGQLAAYGRDQERDADRGGQILASRAGYDPMGMATFMHAMDQMDRLHIGWSRQLSFFATHPTSPERAATNHNRAQSLHWQPREHIAKTQEEFLAHVSGLVLGQDPRQGVFKETRFYHPDMNFSLRFPDGWMLINSNEAVGAVAPRGQAIVQLRLAAAGDDPVAVAHAVMEGELKQANAKIHRAGPMQIGDLPAFRIEGESNQYGVKTGGSLTFVAHEGVVYRIEAISRAGDASKFAGRTRAVARSFRSLTPEERDIFEVTRLKIARAKAGETLAMLSQRTGNSLGLGETAVLNGIFIDAQLEEGRLIKVGITEPYVPQRHQPPIEDEQIEQDPGEPDHT